MTDLTTLLRLNQFKAGDTVTTIGDIAKASGAGDATKFLAGDGTMRTPSGGGGGGAAIQPETGSSPIKISAFPNAAAPMGSGDVVTGLQGGANVNFSQVQILTGKSAAPSSSQKGAGLYITAGKGDGTGGGGPLYAYAGNGGDNGANGGNANFYAGNGGSVTGGGGSAFVAAGNATSGSGGNLTLRSGNSGNGQGGQLYLKTGTGGTNQNGGYMYIQLGNGAGTGHAGRLVIQNLPTSSAGLPSGGVWSNSGVLTIVP